MAEPMNQKCSLYSITTNGVSPYWRRRYTDDAAHFWDLFYKRNTNNFYKDRHWLTSAEKDGFECLAANEEESSERDMVVVEAGCGVGNSVFPLLARNKRVFCYAFDFAEIAIELLKSAQQYDPTRCKAFVWDFADKDLEEFPFIPSHSAADCILLLFVLSAVPPEKHKHALKRLRGLVRPGGMILFRDYATGDLAQRRFANRSAISDRLFVRQDCTLSFFFDEDWLESIVEGESGLKLVSARRIERVIRNRKLKNEMNRVWLQAQFIAV